MVNTLQDNVRSELQTAIGGEWKMTRSMSPVQGYVAHFPKFRSDAIVGVLNDAASRAGLQEQAVAFRSGAASAMLGDAPNAPCEVVVPKELAENPAFRAQLTAEMKTTITHVVSQQLSYGAMQGMQR